MRKLRRKWKEKRRKDPLIPVQAAYVCAAVDQAGYSVAGLARKLRTSQQNLNYIVRGRNKTCRLSLLNKLARELGVTPQWLSGQSLFPTGVPYDLEDRLPALRGFLHRILDLLSPLENTSSRRRKLPQKVKDRLWQLRGTLSVSVSLLAGTHDWPPRFDRLGPDLEDLLSHLRALEAYTDDLPSHLGAIGPHLQALRSHLVHLPYRPPMPARAQLAQHRLATRCFDAWLRDAKAKYPDRINEWLQAAEVSGPTGAAEVVFSNRDKEPWTSQGMVMRGVETLISPAVWRAYLHTRWPEGRMPPVSPEDQDRTVPALATAAEYILEPWFRGDVELDYENFFGLIPDGWRRAEAASKGLEWRERNKPRRRAKKGVKARSRQSPRKGKA